MKMLESLMTMGEYSRSKKILYEVRRTKQYELFQFTRKLMLAAATASRLPGFCTYAIFIEDLEKRKNYSETLSGLKATFAGMCLQGSTYSTFYGVNMETIINGSIGQVEEELRDVLARNYDEIR